MRYLPWLLLLLVCLGFFLFQQGYRFNATPSMPKGIYQLVPGDSGIERGDLVSICLVVEPFASLAIERGYLRSGSCPDGSEPLLKVVMGLPHDLLEVESEGIRINGRLIPHSRIAASDSQDRPMPVSITLSPGRIPEGKVLILSREHPGGFDGRYFGLLPLASLQKVKPVRVFEPIGG